MAGDGEKSWGDKLKEGAKKGVEVAGKAVDKLEKVAGAEPVKDVRKATSDAKETVDSTLEVKAKEPVKSEASKAQPAVAEKAKTAEVAKVDEKKAEVKDRTKDDLEALQKEVQVGVVERKDPSLLQKYFSAVETIKGKEFNVEWKADAIDFDGGRDDIYKKIYDVYKGADFSGLKDLFGIKEEKAEFNNNVRAIVSMALANSFMNKAKEATKYYPEFLKTEAGKGFKDQKITAGFSYAKVAGAKVTGGESFDKAYGEFAKTKPAENKDAAKGAEELEGDAKKIAFMKQTKLGKLIFRAGVKPEDVLSGKSFFAALAFWLLGFGGKLGLPDLFKDVPDTPLTKGAKDALGKMQKSFENSGYHASKDKIDESKLLVTAKAPSYEKFADTKFLETVREKKVLPEAGIVLDGEFKLEGAYPKEVFVDLNKGGEIVLPAGAKLTINGTSIVVPKDKVLTFNKDTTDCGISANKGIAVLTAVIPSGVAFTKGCVLSDKKEEEKK